MKIWQIAVTVILLILSPQGTIKVASLTGKFDFAKTKALYNNKLITPPAVKKEKEIVSVLGENDNIKRIEVDLTNQRLYAYEGSQKIYDFAISSGKWGRTPTGNFRIWTKLRYALMTGGSKLLGTYYYLPNVPFTMFFYNKQIPKWRGFGIHGTYWHSNFGHPMSHGCINMKTEEAGQIYYWANDNPGTEIVIYGDAPYE